MTDTPSMTGLARVRTPVAPLHAAARVSSAQTSQSLFGRPVALLAREGEWWRVQSMPDGYEGWMHTGFLMILRSPDLTELTGARESDAWLGLDTARLPRFSLGCTARVGGRTLRLPLGAWLDAEVEVTAGDVTALPLGTDALPNGEVVVASARRHFEGTSYQWGGLTPWGADCSGMVQSVCALHGVDLPRDAWQQALVGEPVDVPTPHDAALRAGDLLFFSEREDRRITHVGIAAGNGHMLHLALGRGGWADDRMDDADDPYVVALAGRFVGARRLFA